MGDTDRTMASVRTYTVPESVSGSFHHPVLGEIVYAFDAGDHSPASDQDQIVFDLALVPAGLATLSDPGDLDGAWSALGVATAPAPIESAPDVDDSDDPDASDDPPTATATKPRTRRGL